MLLPYPFSSELHQEMILFSCTNFCILFSLHTLITPLGEEVFIDYGIEWEEAWDKHVSEWRAPNAVNGWLTAQEANENKIDCFWNWLKN